MRHQYTRAELESITQETAIYIEGGIRFCMERDKEDEHG